MKKKACMILAALLCVFVIFSGGCAIGDLTGKDTYEGLPLYQYNVEDNTVEIDGALYREIDYSQDIGDTLIGEIIGFIWYKPHFEIEDGVVYTVSMLYIRKDKGYGYKDKQYLYASSYTYYEVGNGKINYNMILERVDT